MAMEDCIYYVTGQEDNERTLKCKKDHLIFSVCCSLCADCKIEDESKTEPQPLKADQGKLRYDLIPLEVLEGLAEVLTHGALKYKENSWQGIEKHRYVAAAFRHFMAWLRGEKLDPDSGLHHLKHAIMNLAFLLFKDIHNII